ncbi:hypothetical protein [Sphingomonas sp. NFX23]|uniref:hypothetical protein n=1 Tax=Sphingomonas sp. NFX23 TaxID=2819532 RepID=UPI003CEEC16B
MLRIQAASMWAALVLFSTSPVQAAPATGHGIAIISGEFGTLGTKAKLDVSQRLQQICGTDGDRCEAFCSETSFGLYDLGRKPICRVTYRCPDGATRAIEAAREEPIVLVCRDETDAEAGALLDATSPGQ